MIKMQRVNKDDCKSNFRLFEKDGTIESRELQVCIGKKENWKILKLILKISVHVLNKVTGYERKGSPSPLRIKMPNFLAL